MSTTICAGDLANGLAVDDYNPILSMPKQMISVQSEWASRSCTAAIVGLYDPPRALTSAASVAGPTGPSAPPVTTSAIPGASTVAPTVQKTSSPSAEAASTVAPPQPASTVPSVAQTTAAGQAATDTSSQVSSDPGPVDGASTTDQTTRQPDTVASAGEPSTGSPATTNATPNAESSGQQGDPQQSTEPTVTSAGASPTTNALSLGTDASPRTSPATQPQETSNSVDPTPDTNTNPTPDPSAAITDSEVPQPTSNVISKSADVSPTAASPSQSTGNVGGIIASVLGLSHTGQSSAQAQASQQPSQDPGSFASESGTGATDAAVNPVTSPTAGESSLAGSTAQAGNTGQAGSTAQAGNSGQAATTSGATTAPPSAFGATVTLGSSLFTVVSQDSNVVLGHDSSTQTLSNGASSVIGSQLLTAGSQGIQIGTSAASLVAISATSADPVNPATHTAASSQNSASKDPAQTIDGQSAATTDPPSSADQVFTFDGKTVTAAQQEESTVLIDGSTTATLGQSGVTLDGTTISAAGSGLVVGGTTLQPVVTPSSADQVFTFDGKTVTAAQQDGHTVLLDGTATVSFGPSGATLGSNTISAASGGFVVDGTTLPTVATPTGAEQVFTFDGKTITASHQDGHTVLIDGSTTASLGPSGVILSGTTISAASNGLVVAGTTFTAIQTADGPVATGAVLTGSDGQTFTVLPQGSGAIVLDGTSTATVAPGAPVTIDGQTINAGSSGLIVDGTTLLPSQIAQESSVDGAVLTGSNGHALTLLPQGTGAIVVDGTSTVTIVPGTPVTLDGETISMLSTGSAYMVNGHSIALSSVRNASPTAQGQSEAVLTGTDGQSVTALREGSSIIVEDASSTVTLGVGSQATIDGITFSAPALSNGVFVDGTTISMTKAPAGTTSSGESGTVKSTETPTSHVVTAQGSSATTTSSGRRSILISLETLGYLTAALIIAGLL